jgi:hypothetical protein
VTTSTALTLAHTAVSVLPVGLGLLAFARKGRIDPRTQLGKWYVGTMLVGSVTAFAFIPRLGFTPGEVLTLVTLALLAVGTVTLRGEWRRNGYVQTVALSTTYLLLMVFATTETLKHFPVGHPFAASAADPALLPVRLGLLAAYLVGLTYQLLRLRSVNTPTARLERAIAQYVKYAA